MKSTQEDPWQHFARTHQLGQVVAGRVTKLVPFGAFVRVEEGIEGLVHISELAGHHVELPDQVVDVSAEIYVKVIDIDLERRRISLSLKQANENSQGGSIHEEFDPYLYGMAPAFDEDGNYIGPDGFDPQTGDWKKASKTSGPSGSRSTPRPRPGGRLTASRSKMLPSPTRRPSSTRWHPVELQHRFRFQQRRNPRFGRGTPGAARQAHRRRRGVTSSGQIRVALTGGIGSGKSTVARVFARQGRGDRGRGPDRPGDRGPGQPALAEIVDRFGSGVIGEDGSLDRPPWPRSCSRTNRPWLL